MKSQSNQKQDSTELQIGGGKTYCNRKQNSCLHGRSVYGNRQFEPMTKREIVVNSFGKLSSHLKKNRPSSSSPLTTKLFLVEQTNFGRKRKKKKQEEITVKRYQNSVRKGLSVRRGQRKEEQPIYQRGKKYFQTEKYHKQSAKTDRRQKEKT